MLEALAGGAFGGGEVVEFAVEACGFAQNVEAVLHVGIGIGGEAFCSAAVIALDLLEVGAAGDAFHGGDDLQLAGAFVDTEDAGVAIEAFAGVFFHESATAVDLDAVVGATVSELAGVELDERGEDVGHARGGFGAGREVDVACRLVHQAAGAVGAGAHLVEEVLYGYELVDGVSELFAAGGIGFGFAAGGLAESDGLCADSQSGAVHERHDVFDESEAAFADDLGGCVGELQLGGRRALDAHFVLDASHGHSAVGFVEDEVGQAASVVGALFAACQHEVQVGIAVGDEALHAVESPAV